MGCSKSRSPQQSLGKNYRGVGDGSYTSKYKWCIEECRTTAGLPEVFPEKKKLTQIVIVALAALRGGAALKKHYRKSSFACAYGWKHLQVRTETGASKPSKVSWEKRNLVDFAWGNLLEGSFDTGHGCWCFGGGRMEGKTRSEVEVASGQGGGVERGERGGVRGGRRGGGREGDERRRRGGWNQAKIGKWR